MHYGSVLYSYHPLTALYGQLTSNTHNLPFTGYLFQRVQSVRRQLKVGNHQQMSTR